MSDYIYQDYNMNDRIKMLQNMSVKSEVKTYNRSLSEAEIENENRKYTGDAIELARQKHNLKAEMERLKAGITSLENLMEERLERVKTGQTETTATLYGLPDHNKGVMNWFDNYGERINTSKLTPDEMQGKLFIGDDPMGKARAADEKEELPNIPEIPMDDNITDVEFEETNGDGSGQLAEWEEQILTDGPIMGDEDLSKAVDEMYAEDGKSVAIDVKTPEEDKPKKAAKKPKAKKGDDSDSPL